MKKLPVGISDFRLLIEEDFYYVDKTLLIKEIHETAGQVKLIPRPRRFGKTLNLSMLKYFYEKTEIDNSYLFAKTKIWQDESYQRLQGQYPVIFLTFKDVKETNWENAYKKIISVIAEEFERYYDLLYKGLEQFIQEEYYSILNKKADAIAYSNSIKTLTKLLYNFNNKRVIILIDEYDTPILAGYNYGYYEQVIQFMRSLLTASLKDNINLERSILTGILRAAKEGIFSGLNNLAVYALNDTNFQEQFGFTTNEVKNFLKDYNLDNEFLDISKWYNGYKFGKTVVYNPWSMLMCVNKQGILKPYWVNTSDNALIKRIITLSDKEIKSELELLLSEKIIKKEIDEAIIFP